MIFGIEVVVEGDCSGFVQKMNGRADAAADWKFDDELFQDVEADQGLGRKTVTRLMSLRRIFVARGTMMRKKMKAVDFCCYLVG
jgi:hypothetical protein